jgi:predicted nucleic acid-binding Zn ribbon protein
MPLPEGEEYCSEECAQARSLALAAERRKSLLFYTAVALVALALLSIRLIL